MRTPREGAFRRGDRSCPLADLAAAKVRHSLAADSHARVLRIVGFLGLTEEIADPTNRCAQHVVQFFRQRVRKQDRSLIERL